MTTISLRRRQQELPLVARMSSASRPPVEAPPIPGAVQPQDAVPPQDGGRRWQVGRGDAVAWLRALPAASVDLAITDPPYESLEKHRAIGTTTRLKHSKASSNDWFAIFPNARFPELFAELYRVLKKNSHFYLFCDPETMFVAKPLAERAGFRFWKPLVWDKRKIGLGYHYRSRYELILFFEKGKRKLTDLGQADILECPRISRGYPSEKPSQVSQVLIRQSSVPDALVIDPFMGSGSTGVAALELGRRFAGCDICQEAIDLTSSRLAALSPPPALRSHSAEGSR
jgi:site-specific DNA-methyltransferase (adenine-specific)